MPTYLYHAMDERGQKVTGAIDADTLSQAQDKLNETGLIPTSVKPGRTAADSTKGRKGTGIFSSVKAPDLILFTKQFQTLIRSGISLLQILQVLGQQTENKTLKATLADMHDAITRGASLYEAFKRHEKVFSPLYCNMIKAGESTGSLPQVLARLIYIIDHEHKVRCDIRSALQYPIIVVIALCIAFFVLLTFVIPKFITIYQSAHLKLPLPTKICMILYDLLMHYWPVLILGIGVAVIASICFLRTRQGRHVKDAIVLKIPLIGPLFVKAAMSRFASIFSIFQASGVPVLGAMAILSKTIGNEAISREFNKIRDRLEQGGGIAGPLQSSKYFPPMVVNMVAIGEESGNLDDMLKEVSTHYDTEVEYAVKKLSESIGPILTVGLAVVVGFFAFAIFLPMWDLTKMVH
jgi:type II secretory pathway component PulF